MKTNRILVLVLSIVLCQTVFAKAILNLHPGTIELGGKIRLPIKIPKEGGAVVGLDVSPTIGYFITKNFSLGFSPNVEATNLSGKDGNWIFGLTLTGTFHFNLGGTVYLYLGGGAGVQWTTAFKNVVLFPLKIPVGLLIAVNNNVAIDFGIPVEFLLSTAGYQGIVLPVGFIGVRGFI